jgi:hypothetical protein
MHGNIYLYLGFGSSNRPIQERFESGTLQWFALGLRPPNQTRRIRVLFHRSNFDSGIDQLTVCSIVAVHGLGAHPKYTWSKLETHEVGIESRHTSTCSKQQSTKALPEIISKRSRRVDWLTDFVPEDFEDASVLKYNHNADWFLDAPKLSIRVAAEKLLTELQTAKRVSVAPEMYEAKLMSDQEKPIVFVGHSYGGLIVKEVSQTCIQTVIVVDDYPGCIHRCYGRTICWHIRSCSGNYISRHSPPRLETKYHCKSPGSNHKDTRLQHYIDDFSDIRRRSGY